MIFNDITLSENKNINLNNENKKHIYILDKLSSYSIDNIWFYNKKNIIKISWNNKIIVKVLKSKNSIDWIKKIILKNNINLKKIILRNRESFNLKSIKTWLLWLIKAKKNYKILYDIIIFLLIIILLLILNRFIIEYFIKSWVNNIKNSLNSKDKTEISRYINKAQLDFKISYYLFQIFKIIKTEDIENISLIINIWQEASDIIENSIIFYNIVEEYNKQNNITNYLIKRRESINNIAKNIDNITKNINKIELSNKYIKYEKDYKKIKLYLNIVNKYTKKINSNFESFLNILWEKETKRYLIIFQNNDEIRASWWFMWSSLIIELKNWLIKKYEEKDIYDLEWEINKTYLKKIKAPEWINKITNNFWLRDANYFPEYSDSADSINFFMKKSKYKIDWVVFINMIPLLSLLKEIWWVDFKKINTHIDETNFSEIISFLVETKYFKNGTLSTPKQVLFDFTEELKTKLINEKKYLKYLEIFEESIKNREIVIDLFNYYDNELIKKLWFNWIINYNNYMDFNYLIYSSIWWNKSDRYISRNYTKNIIIEDNCNIKTNLEIEIENNFWNQDSIRIENLFRKYNIKFNNDILNIAWAWENKSFLRIIIPKNSKFLEKIWQKLIKKEKYNIIELYTKTKSQEKTKYIISYDLENKDCKNYNYKFIKQSWIYEYNLELNINGKKIKRNWINEDISYNTY